MVLGIKYCAALICKNFQNTKYFRTPITFIRSLTKINHGIRLENFLRNFFYLIKHNVLSSRNNHKYQFYVLHNVMETSDERTEITALKFNTPEIAILQTSLHPKRIYFVSMFNSSFAHSLLNNSRKSYCGFCCRQ